MSRVATPLMVSSMSLVDKTRLSRGRTGRYANNADKSEFLGEHQADISFVPSLFFR